MRGDQSEQRGRLKETGAKTELQHRTEGENRCVFFSIKAGKAIVVVTQTNIMNLKMSRICLLYTLLVKHDLENGHSNKYSFNNNYSYVHNLMMSLITIVLTINLVYYSVKTFKLKTLVSASILFFLLCHRVPFLSEMYQ